MYEFSGLKEFPEIDINLAGTLIRMKNNKILDLFTVHPEVADLVSSSGNAGPDKIQLTGLSGSAKALTVAAAFRKSQNTHLVVLSEKEEAAYFYNDLTGLTDDESIFFFPSTYKRSVQYEQTEPANIILRTEVLNHLTSGKRKSIIVSYPESLMEKVVSRQTLKRNTFTISKGDRISLEFLEEILHEYKFERVDFVYDPGQYSVRGSIADVFSFSADMPYRIDFFGEEVDTIRSFNIDDQLSVDMFNHITIIPNIQDIAIDIINNTFLDFIPQSSSIWIEDASFIKDKINNIFSQIDLKNGPGHIDGKKEIIITGEHFIEQCGKFRVLEFGNKGLFKFTETYEFHTEPQPSFNKNFELLSGQLNKNRLSGYTSFIISESQSQIDRLKDIFSEINPDISFSPLLMNLHEGFTDHDLKISIYTDHQIFGIISSGSGDILPGRKVCR